jgi:chemotaxis protein MotA
MILDLFAVLGTIMGVLAVIGAMIFKHISFSVFLNPAAVLVIFAGTIASVMIAIPPAELKNLGKLFAVVFGKPRYSNPVDVANRMVEYSKMARSGGFLALEAQAKNEKDPFFSRALQLLADGTSVDEVEEYLNEDIAAMQQRHAGNAQIFSQAGGYAPTLGVLGAVLGLIAALGDLNDMDKLSAAISAAFIATVLGIFTGYVLWHPMANKLKSKSRLEVQVKTMIIAGVCYIGQGRNPRLVQESMLAYLTAKEKKSVKDV